MSNCKAVILKIRCKECGKQNEILLPLHMTHEELLKTKEDIEILQRKPIKFSSTSITKKQIQVK